MAKNGIKTGKPVASKAAKELTEGKNPTNKSIAGSALSNAKKDTNRKKK